MFRDELIYIGTLMGLGYDEKLNSESIIKNGIVIFDGWAGQTFTISSKNDKEIIYKQLGDALKSVGKEEYIMLTYK